MDAGRKVRDAWSLFAGKATKFCNHRPAHACPHLVYEFRPNITTLEGLLAAATMLSHSEQLELLDELKHMINNT